jgi:serine/threonine protein kinase
MNINQNVGNTLKNFNVIEKLGEGSFANVYKVQRIDDKKLYAMKKV